MPKDISTAQGRHMNLVSKQTHRKDGVIGEVTDDELASSAVPLAPRCPSDV